MKMNDMTYVIAGMTAEIIEKLQEKATVLTQERKKRGKTVPEDLMSAENIGNFVTQSSHPGLHSASVPGELTWFLSVLPGFDSGPDFQFLGKIS